jgi:hypothetical protein
MPERGRHQTTHAMHKLLQYQNIIMEKEIRGPLTFNTLDFTSTGILTDLIRFSLNILTLCCLGEVKDTIDPLGFTLTPFNTNTISAV